MPSLQANLQEIHSACRCDGALAPSPFSDKVYHSGRGWGRLWKWLYSAIKSITGKDVKSKQLQKTMEKTQTVFNKQFTEVKESLQYYQEYLKTKTASDEVDEKETHLHRKKITRWNQATTPFLSLTTEKTSAIFKKYFPDETNPFKTEELSEDLSLVQHLIDLEGYLHSPLPLNLLAKLAQKEILIEQEKKQLEKWTKTLNRKSQIPQKRFRAALVSFVKSLGSTASLTDLEMGLSEHKLQLFFQPDPFHMQWRETLQSGEALTCNEEEYILDEPLSAKDEEDGTDHILYFTIKDEPKKVIAIGINPSFIRIKEQINEKYQWGIPMPTIHTIEENGNFAVVERMSTTLLDHKWAATPHDIPYEDEKVLFPLANMLKWWCEQSLTPSKFSLKHLQFDTNGILKYTHSLIPDLFNYSLLEDLAIELANGNLDAYRYLVKKSSLSTHIIVDFYKKMISQAIENEPANAENLAACRKITDPEVIKRGKTLYKETQSIRKQVLKTLSLSHMIENQNKILITLNDLIITWHKQKCSASQFWPNAETSIIKELIFKYKLKPKSHDAPSSLPV